MKEKSCARQTWRRKRKIKLKISEQEDKEEEVEGRGGEEKKDWPRSTFSADLKDWIGDLEKA